MVAKAAKDNQPAIGLTDHGVMGGTVQLYQAAKKYGILPFPGVEAYLLDPNATLDDKKAGRYHLGLLATNLRGYQGLIKAVSLTHTRPRFNRFPRLTLEDLADLGDEYGDGLILTTGCYFGLVQQTLVNDGPAAAERIVRMYAQWFPHTIVELQNHSICHDQDLESNPYNDDDIVDEMYGIAQRVGLPVMATQDSHYLDQKDKAAHSLMKKMVYGGADDAFPGDSFHLASTEWVQDHYPEHIWADVEQGAAHILEQHELVIPPLEKFQAHVPSIVDDPQDYITKKCRWKLRRYLNKTIDGSKHGEYKDRLAEELSVIEDLGMAGYFTLVEDYVVWCNTNHYCIEARGSANASLVCFLLGITQTDPVQWNLLFSRFLSRDRTKPPDIDMDIEDVSRGALLSYLQNSFDTLQIGTYSQLGSNDEGKGSVLVTYRSGLARNAESQEAKTAIYAKIQTIDDVQRYYPDDYVGLKRLSDMEGVYKSYGVHAAGILLSGNEQKIEDYVPQMLVASSETLVSQFDMDDVEKLGYLKLDVLGQTSLTVMRICQELMGRDYPTDFSWIPNDDPAACKALREGRLDTGIFHYEGYALADDEPVLTPNGWVPIGQLQVGDIVVDPDGGTATVRGVYPQGEKRLWRVTLANGKSVLATDDHLWNYKINNEQTRTDTTRELRRHLSTTVVPHLTSFVPTDLGSGDRLEVDPYVLGLLLGDGCLTNKHVVRFTAGKDVENVSAITAAYPELIAVNDPKQPLQWWFRNPKKRGPNPLKEGIAALGLFGLSAKSKHVPYHYKWASFDTRLAVLQGLLDTDGYVQQNGSVRYSTVSPQLAQDVEFLVRSLGGQCTVDLLQRTAPWNSIYIISNIRLPNGIEPVRLLRRLNELTPIKRKHGLAVRSIEKAHRGAATCIEVDSVSQCFITRDFIVTHNTKSKGGKELGIKSTADAVLGQGLFMPGAMDTGQKDLYIQRRKNATERKAVTYIHDAFKDALQWTHGTVIFQEQVINIMRGLGMSIESINVFFKIVKSSGSGSVAANAERMATMRTEFDDVCRAAGIAEDQLDEAWGITSGFIGYAFNLAHATGYGIRSYRTAYLKTHYPLEYMTALLTAWAGRGTTKKGQPTKEFLYQKEARRVGIRILPPDVNVSNVSWTIDRDADAIRKGIVSIKGVGTATAENIVENAPYTDVADLIARTDSRKVTGSKTWEKDKTLTGTMEALRQANALKSLGLKGDDY